MFTAKCILDHSDRNLNEKGKYWCQREGAERSAGSVTHKEVWEEAWSKLERRQERAANVIIIVIIDLVLVIKL